MGFPIPTWVASDPSREVAVDALGLSWQADQLADALLPDLSVLTRRARYLSFLPWAISKTVGANNPEREIHRLEAKLAIWAAKPHGKKYPKCCQGLVGRESARRYLLDHNGKSPISPEALFKNTAFRAYRSLLRAIRLLDDSTGTPALRPDGTKVASAFGRNAHGTCACMRDISADEKQLLRKALGFDKRIKPTLREERRQATVIELNKRFCREELSPGYVLSSYTRKPSSEKHSVPTILHKAYVWELLSLGLTLAFVCVLKDMQLAPFAGRLKKAVHGRPSIPPLTETEHFRAENEDAARHVVALLRYGCSLLPSELGLQKDTVDLAKCLFDNSPKSFLEKLLYRHEEAKGTEAWVSIIGSNGRLQRLSPPRKGLPDRADLHTYRLSAFAELGEDLDLWK